MTLADISWLSFVNFFLLGNRMGAMMGGGVGLTIGFIFGSYSIIRSVPSYHLTGLKLTFRRNGAGPRGFLATLSQYMLTSAATFGFFLSIGSVSVTVLRDHLISLTVSMLRLLHQRSSATTRRTNFIYKPRWRECPS